VTHSFSPRRRSGELAMSVTAHSERQFAQIPGVTQMTSSKHDSAHSFDHRVQLISIAIAVRRTGHPDSDQCRRGPATKPFLARDVPKRSIRGMRQFLVWPCIRFLAIRVDDYAENRARPTHISQIREWRGSHRRTENASGAHTEVDPRSWHRWDSVWRM